MKDANYDYFINNLSTLFKEYGHSFLVIKNRKIIGSYDDFNTAYEETRKTEEVGTFLIQECVSEPAQLIQSFQGNIFVA